MHIRIKAALLISSFLLFTTLNFSQIIDTSQKWIKVKDGLNFPEGPAYDGDSSIYLSNCYGGWIGKFSKGMTDTFLINNDLRININKTNGLAYGKDGYLYVCEYGYGQILRVDKNSNIEVYANGYKGERFNRPNDIILDNEGNLYFTDPNSYDKNILDGRIFFIDAKTKEIILIADSLAFPNGINISPIDKKLYVCESAKQKIVRFDIVDQSYLTNKEDFVQIPNGDPDGIEFDINGNLYVTHYGGKAVYIFSPNGKLLEKIDTPGAKPTNLEFGGEAYKTLYLTEVETNALYSIKVKIPGCKK
jgi:gluconolactonase